MLPKQLADIAGIKEYSSREHEHGYIYFIVKLQKVIYVGQTVTPIWNRLADFKNRNEVYYDKVYYFICSLEDLTKQEQYYIDKFSPPYNIAHNKNRKSIPCRHCNSKKHIARKCPEQYHITETEYRKIHYNIP